MSASQNQWRSCCLCLGIEHYHQECRHFTDKNECGAQRRRDDDARRCEWYTPKSWRGQLEYHKARCIDAGSRPALLAWGTRQSRTQAEADEASAREMANEQQRRATMERRQCRLHKAACQEADDCIWAEVPKALGLGGATCRTREEARRVATSHRAAMFMNDKTRERLCTFGEGTWTPNRWGLPGGSCT